MSLYGFLVDFKVVWGSMGLVESTSPSFLIKTLSFSVLMDRLRPLYSPWGVLYMLFICKIWNLVKIHEKNRFTDLVCIYRCIGNFKIVCVVGRASWWYFPLIFDKKKNRFTSYGPVAALAVPLNPLEHLHVQNVKFSVHSWKNRFSDLVWLSTGTWSTSRWFVRLVELGESSSHSCFN